MGPTWEKPIRSFFRDFDIDEMKPQGIDLGSYVDVKKNAEKIHQRVAGGDMPCDQKWAPEMVATFKKWIDDGMPYADHPNFWEDIYPLLTDNDIASMRARGGLLTDVKWWKQKFESAYERLKSGNMPLGGPRWDEKSLQKLNAWKENGFLEGPKPSEE